MLVLGGAALVADEDPATTNLAVSPSPAEDSTTSTPTSIPNLFTVPTTTTAGPAPSTTAAARPVTTARPATTVVTQPSTASPTTTVPVGPPMTTRAGTDAHYTWIEGTSCVGDDARVLLEFFDAEGQPNGDEGAIPAPDGSWRVPVSPPPGEATIRGDCVNFTTKAVYLTYPPLVFTFT